MILSLADSLFRLFREHSDVVSVNKLKKDGVRSVTVLDWKRIDELIAKAVDEALQARGVELSEEDLAGVNKAAREAFARLLAQRDNYRDTAQLLDQQRGELMINLDRLRSEVRAAEDRLSEERKHRVSEADVAVGMQGMEAFTTRLRADLEILLREGGAAPEGLAARVEKLARRLLAEERERALDQAAREQQERMELLQRRIAKLNGMLNESEQVIDRLKRSKAGDPGVESIYRDVQGLSPEDARARDKRGLLDEIFKLNVELREMIEGQSGTGVVPGEQGPVP